MLASKVCTLQYPKVNHSEFLIKRSIIEEWHISKRKINREMGKNKRIFFRLPKYGFHPCKIEVHQTFTKIIVTDDFLF